MKKIVNQSDEPMVLQLLRMIGTTNKVAVDIGARDGGPDSNTFRLRTKYRWQCYLWDAHPKAPCVHEAWITAENIEETFRAAGVPASFDLLSIDVDGNDFYLWQAVSHYWPRVVVIEYNSSFGPGDSRVIPYDPDRQWDKTNYYGASATAFQKLGREKGYSLVAVHRPVNLCFVKDEALLPPAEPCHPVVERQWETY